MKILKAVVIGCGKIGSEFADDPMKDRIGIYSHAEAYHECLETELVGVCDTSEKQALAAGRRWGLDHVYYDARQLLENTRPDLVSICTPDSTHASLGRLAMDFSSVKGVLMEKPLSTTLNEGAALVKLAERKGIKLAVNYSRRYSKAFRKLKEKLNQGDIGAIQAVHGYYTKGVIHNGTHWIDILRFLVGEIVEGEMIKLNKLLVEDADVDAHLFDYDISEDLSMWDEPVIMPPQINMPASSTDLPLGLRCSIRF